MLVITNLWSKQNHKCATLSILVLPDTGKKFVDVVVGKDNQQPAYTMMDITKSKMFVLNNIFPTSRLITVGIAPKWMPWQKLQ